MARYKIKRVLHYCEYSGEDGSGEWEEYYTIVKGGENRWTLRESIKAKQRLIQQDKEKSK